MKKAPFIFRKQINKMQLFIKATAAAMFAQKEHTERDIDPPKRNHQGATNKSGGSQPSGHRITKKERKRREHIRHLNPNRKH